MTKKEAVLFTKLDRLLKKQTLTMKNLEVLEEQLRETRKGLKPVFQKLGEVFNLEDDGESKPTGGRTRKLIFYPTSLKEARKMRMMGASNAELARYFGCTAPNIAYHIKRGNI